MASTTKRSGSGMSGKAEAVFYVRVSSTEQEQEGFSIPAQVRAAKEYARANGLAIVEEFVDVESARKSGRREFERMLTYLKKSKTCRIIVVEKTDRLYRNLKDYVTIDELMSDRGVAVHLYKESQILSTESRSNEKFMHGIRVLMAKNFIDNLSEEVKKGLSEKAMQGHYPGPVPVGYVHNIATKRIEVDRERALMIRKLFEMYATGEYSAQDLRKVAKVAGLTYNTKGGGPVSKSGIERILKNPLYHGEFEWKGKVYPGKHEPIISKSLYEKVQAIMHGRKGGVYQERTFAFTGLLTCGHCGCQLTAEFKKGKYTYYRCTGSRGKCPEKYMREEVVDEQLGRIVAGLQLDDRVFQSLREALRSSHEDEQRFLKENLARLQGREVKLVNRLQQLYVDKLDGTVVGEVYDRLKAQWEAELDQVRDEIAANQSADRKYLEYGVRLLELAQTAYQSYSRRSPEQKRQLLKFVVSNCSLKDGVLTPVYRQPFDLLASTASMLQKREAPDLSDQELLEIRGG